MQVREATAHDKDHWNTFVETEAASFFHYFEWKTIYEINNWQYIPLILENNSHDIIGILPLVKIKSLLFSKLVSLPDGASGGFIFHKNLTETEKQQAICLFLTYINQYYSKGCSTLYLKENLSIQDATQNQPTEILSKNGFTFRFDEELQLPCTYRLPLTSSFQNDIWEQRWGKYLRNHIRKAEKKGISIKEDRDGKYQDEIISMMTSIYKKFNEPPPSKEEMTLRLTTFKGKTKIWVAFRKDTPLAVLVCYYYQSSVCYASKLGYNTSAREYYTTALLFSEAIRDACEHNYHFFEFGVTERETLAKWKEQFKPIKIPLRLYQKKYSKGRAFFEKTPAFFRWVLKNKDYVWNHRRRLIRKILRGKAQI